MVQSYSCRTLSKRRHRCANNRTTLRVFCSIYVRHLDTFLYKNTEREYIMKLLITVSDQVWGGKHTYMYALISELRSLGHDVVIAAESNSAFSARVRQAGFVVKEVSSFSLSDNDQIGQLSGCVEGCDAVVMSGRRDFAAMEEIIPASVVSVLIRHSAFPLDDDVHTRRRIASLDLLIVTSEEQRFNQFEFLERAHPVPKICVLRSGLREPFFEALQLVDRHQARKELGIQDEKPLLLCVARLSWEKQIDSLFRSFAHVVSVRADVRLVLVGSGPEEPGLRKLADDLGVANQIEFLGHRDDVTTYLKAADIFVFTSGVAETGPLALKEAMAAGLPVVADAVGGISEFITHEHNGIFVSSEKERTGQILRVLEDSDLASFLAQEALKTARREFRFEGRVREFSRLLERCLLAKQSDGSLLRELAWDGVRVRKEDFGGYLFAPRTSHLMEIRGEIFDVVADSVRVNDPTILSPVCNRTELLVSIHDMGALVRPGSETPDYFGSRL
ncbi:glycosyltransferase family 1 protein [Rathayibacter toxicus]|nr:glycosyltransferase family 1 protein [Rathayibacter toxicus]QWL32104.1 glycosyltransferase family 1 protein [Rathayibacter toxicus]QWL34198.1 glycosyltransferase family 1 protein [Rathayibacter toxicus]QWL36330.1 glycosyltransferase family 1 protein [Rathayibacter toxicus]QWL38421.1 glycosyltransferase family 1 protein [Rathayibacter toxicus]